MRADKQVEPGELILFTCGEYSDYSVCGLYRMLKGFNLRERWRDWQHDHRDSWYAFGDGKANFLTMLTQEGLIEEVDYTEFHRDD